MGTFDRSRCDEGNVISDDGRTLLKSGGADFTSTFGVRVVECGMQKWDVLLDKTGTDGRSNVMIGVANPELPLDHPWRVWLDRDPVDKDDGKFFFVKSPGNSTKTERFGYWEASDFGDGDIITVEVDLDMETVSFKKNGVSMGDPQGNVRGPVSLWINLDYKDDQVTILDS